MSETNPIDTDEASLGDRLFALLQYVLPHHALSRLMLWATRSEWRWLKSLLIENIVRLCRVEMGEAAEPNPAAYRSFNDFFTRPLRADVRPLDLGPDRVLSPVDGAVSQAGAIREGRIFQAKGRDYTLLELLGGDSEWTRRFDGGSFATIYLSPRDYHRIHMPATGTLQRMIHVPGRLFSVNPATTRAVPRLFSRNERVVSLFDGPAGPFAVIMVGAIFVSSMDTVWSGTVTPADLRPTAWNYGAGKESPVTLEQGAEMGRFNMGSTVVLLFPKDAVTWSEHLQPGTLVRMGARIGMVGG